VLLMQVLGKMADGVLLVVRPGVVDSASAAPKSFGTIRPEGSGWLMELFPRMSLQLLLSKEYYAEERYDYTRTCPIAEVRKISEATVS